MMNKKIMFGILGMFLLLGTVAYAGVGIFATNKSISISDEQELKAVEIGVDTYSYEDINHTDYYERVLISNSNYNLPSKEFPKFYEVCSLYNETAILFDGRNISHLITTLDDSVTGEPALVYNIECLEYSDIYYTEAELEIQMDGWQSARLKGIADVEIERKRNQNGTVIRTGTITFSEK